MLFLDSKVQAWVRSESGYRLIAGYEYETPGDVGEQQPYIVEREAASESDHSIQESQVAYYDLAAQDTLFLEFSELEGSEASILEFANQFGFLGGAITRRISLSAEPLSDEPLLKGEALSDWKREIAKLRDATQLLNALNAEQQEVLSELISVKRVNKEAVYCSLTPKALGSRLVVIDTESPLYLQTNDGDYRGVAKYFLKDAISRQAIAGRLVIKETAKELCPTFIPATLLDAMWTQFATALNEQRQFQRCKECGKGFALSLRKARLEKLYCSNACNVRAYRKRKDEAVKSNAPQKSPTKRAKQPGIKIEQTKK